MTSNRDLREFATPTSLPIALYQPAKRLTFNAGKLYHANFEGARALNEGPQFYPAYAQHADTLRRWSEDEKQAIIREALQPAVNVSAVSPSSNPQKAP